MIGRRKLIRIGFWRPKPYSPPSSVAHEAGWLGAVARLVERATEQNLPKVEDDVDPAWSPHERAEVLAYMAQEGRVHESWYGMSTCRICGCQNGSRDYTDDVFLWPEGFPHYIREHQVKPPQDFIGLVLPLKGRPRR